MNGPFMNRRPLTAVAAAVIVAMGLSACASNTGSTDAATGGAYGIDWAKNAEQWGQLPADHVAGEMITEEEWYEILGPVPEEPIELALFKGGFGEEWGDIITELMEKEHPGIQLEFTWDPSIAEKIQPRLIAGDVPDVLFYGFADPAQAVTDELAMPVDILLDVEGYGDLGGQRLGDWFVPGSLESANANFPENTWAFPQTSFTFGVFYNGTLFDENGWPAPSELTWEEFVELQEEIAQELPVWAYAGGNAPGYFGYVTQPLIYKNIGADAWCDLNNVVEGAWNNPGIVEALELQQQIMTTPGFQLAGTEAMTHTESQQAFVEGKVAMIPNGSWLSSEQKSTTPEGFDMRFSAVPAPANGLGFPQAIAASLGVTGRHERVDPLYRSVGTFVAADQEQNAVELTSSLGALSLQGAATSARDNLGAIASILTTRTRSTTWPSSSITVLLRALSLSGRLTVMKAMPSRGSVSASPRRSRSIRAQKSSICFSRPIENELTGPVGARAAIRMSPWRVIVRFVSGIVFPSPRVRAKPACWPPRRHSLPSCPRSPGDRRSAP